MNLLKKMKLFTINLWNSWPVEEQPSDTAFLTLIATEDFDVLVDFNFTIENVASLANILFQLDSGLLTGVIVETINQQCVLRGQEDEFAAFMTSLHLISEANKQMTDVSVSEPVIKPSHVFKYTVEQPKLN